MYLKYGFKTCTMTYQNQAFAAWYSFPALSIHYQLSAFADIRQITHMYLLICCYASRYNTIEIAFLPPRNEKLE